MTALRPYLVPLRRHRLMPLLVVAQTALACAILANVLFLLWQKLGPMLVPDGIPRNQLVLVDQLISSKGSWNAAQVRSATEALRAIPGVVAVSPTIGLPMSSTMTMTGRVSGPEATETVSLFTGDALLDALGLQLSSGRDFSADERKDVDLGAPDAPGQTEPVIVTDALARHMFGDRPALGGVLTGKDPKDPTRFVVVGTVRHLLRYQIDELDDGKAEFSMVTAGKVTGVPILTFAVRTAREQRQAVIAAIPSRLKRVLGADMMDGIDMRVSDYESQRDARLKPRRAAIWLFGTVSAVVATITLIGIASLSGFWIQQRTRQIGIRRALGATRGQVLRHFQVENLLVTGSGIVLGMPLAYAANLWLLQHYELPRLPTFYLPVGLVAMSLLGQLAVLGPALRAAAIAPAVATRSA